MFRPRPSMITIFYIMTLIYFHYLVWSALNMYRFLTSLVLGLAYIAQSYAAPVEALQSRDLATCQDPNAGIDPSCWDLLDLTTFITNWNKTTPMCPPGPTTGKCCGATEAWTTCFLRMNQPESGSDCTTISSCAFSPSLKTIPNDSHMTAQAHYVVFNIYGEKNATLQCPLLNLCLTD